MKCFTTTKIRNANVRRYLLIAVLVAAVAALMACTASRGPKAAGSSRPSVQAQVPEAPVQPEQAAKSVDEVAEVREDPIHIQPGDYVAVHYGLSLLNGELIVTSSKKRAENPEQKRAAWFFAPEEFGPEKLIAGKESATPELAKAVIGMTLGGKKSVQLPPEQGFGRPDEQKIAIYPRTRKVPLKTVMTAQEYVSRFNSFPKIGLKVPLTPYFQARVTDADEHSVKLEALPKDGEVIPAEFGDTLVSVQGEEIVMTLTPKKGAPFEFMGQSGVVREVDEASFKVDYNHPGAGQTLVLDMEIVSFAKASEFQSKEMAWVEDHDKGFELAAEKEKPMVLVLYAGWCGWSKRFLTETVKDPRVQEYWDDFVWTKVDSDKNKEYHDYYEQNGYPLIVLVDSHGDVIKKLSGFQDARTMVTELNQCLHGPAKG